MRRMLLSRGLTHEMRGGRACLTRACCPDALCLAPCRRSLAMFLKEGDAGPKLLPAAAKKLQASGKKGALDTSKFAKPSEQRVEDYRKQGEFGAKKFIKP